MKTKLLTLASVLACLLVAGHFYARPVLAQVRAALVQNIDEPGRNPYQEAIFSYNAPAYCGSGSTFCNFNYSPVPAGKRLVLTHISGYVDLRIGYPPSGVIQSSFGGNQYAAVFITGSTRTPLGTYNRVIVNQEVLAYFGPGEVPHVFYAPASGDTFAGEGNMMLSGYYIDL